MTDLVPYTKPYQTSLQLCQKLIEQNLIIENKKNAELIIERCSYYRFKAYLSPFLDQEKKFNGLTTFNDLYSLYKFDEELRLLVFRNIQHIEIGVRSLFDQHMTVQTNNKFWYLSSAYFSSASSKHVRTISKVRDMFVASKEDFALHFSKKYYNEHCPFYRDLPPGWVAIELMSFGNISNLLKGLHPSYHKELNVDRFVQKKFNVKNYQIFFNWISVIHDVRNLCGHHSRLFNRNLKAPTSIKKILNEDIELVKTKPVEHKKEEEQLNRIYTALAAMQRILTGLGYDKFGNELTALFNKYPISKKFHPAMGFPANWEDEKLFF